MDPWLNCQSKDVTPSLAKFEDNFDPELLTHFFEKLPDSQQYIAILERKLDKLKKNPDFLAQLSAKREDCMRQLLNCHVEEVNIQEEYYVQKRVGNAQILRTVAPHRQALNYGETVEFIKFDQLENNDNNNSLEK